LKSLIKILKPVILILVLLITGNLYTSTGFYYFPENHNSPNENLLTQVMGDFSLEYFSFPEEQSEDDFDKELLIKGIIKSINTKLPVELSFHNINSIFLLSKLIIQHCADLSPPCLI